MRRNTKIVATYGPAIATDEKLSKTLEAGADVIRLNLSHGDHASHAKAVKQVRAMAARLGRQIGLLLDLRGPKIRVGQLAQERLELRDGETILLTDQPTPAQERSLPIEGYPHLAADVKPGEPILLDDGAVALEVTEVRGDAIACRVVSGGPVSWRKGVNLPATNLSTLQIPTEKDWQDLAFGLEQGVDWVALSFVRGAAEIRRLQERIAQQGAQVPVIAKIEKREALRELDSIVEAADGIMVARGDLGVETNLEEVALRQKEIIAACNRAGKVVITATQMLESMITRSSPTRAEVADVSNAIFDGTDAIMLSGETSVGAHPVEAVSFMARIAERTESRLDVNRMLRQGPFLSGVPDAVAHAACVTARQISADALLCLTRSGLTARLVSRYRPCCPILAVSPNLATVRQLSLIWGVQALHLDADLHGESLIEQALRLAQASGRVTTGNRVVITAGVSAGALRGQTNLVRVEEIRPR